MADPNAGAHRRPLAHLSARPAHALELQSLNGAGYALTQKIGKWTIEIIKRSDQAKGFEILPRRWVVERTFAWLSKFRRLAVRYERRADIHLAFTILACAIICFER